MRIPGVVAKGLAEASWPGRAQTLHDTEVRTARRLRPQKPLSAAPLRFASPAQALEGSSTFRFLLA